MVPFVNRTFEWGVVSAPFLSVLSLGPCLFPRLTNFLHPKLREIDAVLITPQLIALSLRHAVSAPIGPPAYGPGFNPIAAPSLRSAGMLEVSLELLCEKIELDFGTSPPMDSSIYSMLQENILEFLEGGVITITCAMPTTNTPR